jgi:hypothetical protein
MGEFKGQVQGGICQCLLGLGDFGITGALGARGWGGRIRVGLIIRVGCGQVIHKRLMSGPKQECEFRRWLEVLELSSHMWGYGRVCSESNHVKTFQPSWLVKCHVVSICVKRSSGVVVLSSNSSSVAYLMHDLGQRKYITFLRMSSKRWG